MGGEWLHADFLDELGVPRASSACALRPQAAGLPPGDSNAFISHTSPSRFLLGLMLSDGQTCCFHVVDLHVG